MDPWGNRGKWLQVQFPSYFSALTPVAQINVVTLPLVAKSSTANHSRPFQMWQFALLVWKKGGKKFLQTNWKKAVDLVRLDFHNVMTINHRNSPQFTFELPPLFLSVTQHMTQSWPSQQVLGGDPAQRMLYSSKACQCVECDSLVSIMVFTNYF